MRTASRTLTGQELEIMKVVWELRQATVRGVYEKLREQRPIAYTTVMTMMNILEQKGFLKKLPAEGRAYVYQSTRPRKQVIRSMVREFVDRVFNGSAEPLMVQLMQDRHLSREEVERIARAIEEGQ
jgi:BlaI family transcriptional regulator, penicillinase repressor